MWLELSKAERTEILGAVSLEYGIPAAAIEKDWWVTRALQALFTSEYSEHLVFKGGTSLSKGWHAINRFSEDIDIGINRELLGFSGELSKNQISDRLRRASKKFVDESLKNTVHAGLVEQGIDSSQFAVYTEETPISTTDPRKIYIEYESISESRIPYFSESVQIEAGARSILDPKTDKTISSLIDDTFAEKSFVQPPFNVRLTPLGRTFLEKVFLLHEEFSKPADKVRATRMSRHMYDLEKLMDSSEAKFYLSVKETYESIIHHRKTFIGLSGFDYSTLSPHIICIIPEDAGIRKAWKEDYDTMRSEMIFGDTLSFEQLLSRLEELQNRFRNLSWQ